MKKQSAFQIAASLIMIWFCSSCNYYKADKLNPPDGFECDTTNITFNATIINILSTNCLLCHSNVAAIDNGGGIYLDTWEDVKSRSTLVSGAINHTGGYIPMPKNAPKLDPCLITQIEIWIRDGMPEN
jgi:hypothetical protein